MPIKKYSNPLDRAKAHRRSINFYNDTKKLERFTAQLLKLDSSPEIIKEIDNFFLSRKNYRERLSKLKNKLYQYGVLTPKDDFEL